MLIIQEQLHDSDAGKCKPVYICNNSTCYIYTIKYIYLYILFAIMLNGKKSSIVWWWLLLHQAAA